MESRNFQFKIDPGSLRLCFVGNQRQMVALQLMKSEIPDNIRVEGIS